MARLVVRDLPTDLDALDEVLEEIASECGVDAWPGGQGFKFRVGVSEALVNAMKHGNQGDPSKQVHLELAISDSEVEVKIRDQGVGFAPSDVPDPTEGEMLEAESGRGLFLMRQLCEEVKYNSAGNEVTLLLKADG